MKKNKRKRYISLNGNIEDQENILELLNQVKREKTYKEKRICLGIVLDRITDITENENTIDIIADILIEVIK